MAINPQYAMRGGPGAGPQAWALPQLMMALAGRGQQQQVPAYQANFGNMGGGGGNDMPTPMAQMLGAYNGFGDQLQGAMNQIGQINANNAQQGNYNNYLAAAYELPAKTELERTRMNNDAALQMLNMKLSRYDNTVPVLASILGGQGQIHGFTGANGMRASY